MKRKPYVQGPNHDYCQAVRSELVKQMGETNYRAWMASRLLFVEGSIQWVLAAREKLAELVEAGRQGLAA